ncbi:restriction endonuclease subunit S [Vibrio parahaemolyticus]|uniref:restriction endonuclease subunit S n=1 Tax=Vibrio parahaemolyticus TaxID=670 RepID=UPI00387A96E7
MGKYHGYQAYKKGEGAEWLGDIPEHWQTLRGKYVFKEVNERSESGDETLLSVSEYYGVKPRAEKIADGEHLSRAESLVGYKKCEVNDLVMNIMLAWKRGQGVSKYKGIVSPAYSVFRFFDNANPDFMHYLFRTDLYTGHFKTRSTGVIDSRLRLYPESFFDVDILLPTLGEQTQIANFLDHETAKIDTLIEKQQQLIKLLKEKRQAVISHAVTKGLNPQAPMKDSGVEWLGEVPEHWEIPKIGLACDVTKLTGFEYTNHWAVSDDGEIIALRGFNIKERFLDLLKVERISSKLSKKLSRSKLNLGDIVLPCTGTLGNACVIEADDTFHINQNIAKLSFDSRVDPHFASYWLTSEPFRRMVDFNNTSGMQPVLLIGDIRNMPLPMPPKSEQKQIVESLKNQVGTIERTIFNGESAVNLLKERRTALISAAVTGKIDVRNWQAPTHQGQALEQTA